VVFFEIKSGEDEEEIVKLSQTKRVILQCSDWTIIPLENLIAKGADVIAQVKNLDEVQTAFGILEKGVEHVLFYADDVVELKKVLSWLRSEGDKISLQTAEIVEVRPVGMGDRVCVDTCTSMGMGQGMLVGNSSSALFLIHSESISNPRYLSELSAGDQVLVVDFKGNTSTGIVGRLKIEKRPLMLIKAVFDGKEIATIVQNAETIRLTDPEGKALSVVSLVPGDKVLVAMEEGGRHFGIKIEESITEK